MLKVKKENQAKKLQSARNSDATIATIDRYLVHIPTSVCHVTKDNEAAHPTSAVARVNKPINKSVVEKINDYVTSCKLLIHNTKSFPNPNAISTIIKIQHN